MKTVSIITLSVLVLAGCGTTNIYDVELAREQRLAADSFYAAQLGARVAASQRPTFRTEGYDIKASGDTPGIMEFYQPQVPVPVSQYEGSKSTFAQVLEAADSTIGAVGGGIMGGLIGAAVIDNNSSSSGGGGSSTKASPGLAVPAAPSAFNTF